MVPQAEPPLGHVGSADAVLLLGGILVVSRPAR